MQQTTSKTYFHCCRTFNVISYFVELVVVEDITNDGIRTHDLTLQVNSIANQIQSPNIDTPQSEQLMFTQQYPVHTQYPIIKHEPV